MHHSAGEEPAPAARERAAPSDALRSPAGRRLLAVTVLGSGMAFLDATAVNVALPTMGRDLHASTAELQWVLSGYLLSLASLILLGGSLGDRHGHRRAFDAGLVVFTLSSLFCAVAPDASVLVGARLLQGVGAALLTPNSLAMVESGIAPSDRPRAIGAWAGLTGVASAAGPLLGGWLVTAVSWRAVFLINLPVGVVAWVLARPIPDSGTAGARHRPDVLGALSAVVALAGWTYVLIETPEHGLTTAVLAAGIAGAAATASLIAAERRASAPLVPARVLSSRFIAANGVTFVVYTALGGVFFLLVAFMQIALGYSPLAAGAGTLPVTLLMLLFSPAAGSLAQRIGPRTPLTVGSLVIAAGLLLMTRIGPDAGYLTGVLPSVIVFGAGLTLVVSPVTATALAAVEDRDTGIASGVNSAVARVAGLLAVAVLPVAGGLTGEAFYEPAAMTDGFHTAMAICAAVALAGAVLAWLTIDPQVLHPATAES